MELRTVREMRQNEQLTKTAAKKTEEKPAENKSARPSADKLTVSRQALSWLEEQNRKMWEEEQARQQRRQDRMNDSLSALENSKHELDALEKAMKVMRLCQKIAASIMKGDRVPPEDLKYLMNNDPDGYKLAMAMRRHKEDPEDVESVLEEENSAKTEEGEGEAVAASSGGEAPSGGGEPSSGGGETGASAE